MCFLPILLILGQFEEPRNEDLGSYLPGEFQVTRASARPAARAYFLLFAAAQDQYETTHKEVLATRPYFARLVRGRLRNTFDTFENYDRRCANFAPIVDRKAELRDLEAFLAAGYSGTLKPQIVAYIEELKK